MNRIKQLKDDLNEFIAKENNGTNISASSNANLLANILPFHPKSIAEAKREESNKDDFVHLYDRFCSDLLSSMSGQNRFRKNELCSAISFLQDVISLLDSKRVFYRCIMAINIFKNSKGRLNDLEIEQAKAGIFSTADKYDEDTLTMISEIVINIRSLVGLKILNEVMANTWGIVKGDPTAIMEPIVTGSMTDMTTFKSVNRFSTTSTVTRIFETMEQELKSPVVVDDQQPSVSWATNEVQWPQWEIERRGENTEKKAKLGTVESNTIEDIIEEPLSSKSKDGLSCADIMNSIVIFFPDNHEFIIRHFFELLESDKTDEQLQGELIDLIGFDHFEMVANTLQWRTVLTNEMKEAKNKMNKLSSINPNKLIPLQNNGPTFCQQVTIQSKAQADLRKEMRKEQKRATRELNRIQHAFGEEEKLELELAQKEMLRQRQLEMDQLRWIPTLKSGRIAQEIYPYVFDARIQAGHTMLAINGMKYALPEGSSRESFRTYEEISVPPVDRGSVQDVQLIYIKDMDELGQLGFKGFEKLNIIQSLVFEQAYKTKENLLICAPTGAGKTNIAMLTILNTIHEHCAEDGTIAKDDFKIIYIAPMKALATEMTDSFGKRLAPLGLKVRELTGDTVLSKKEIAETQMLVLTPEKWDVVTRKGSSDTSLASLVRLLIIDEVHLLHDDRGPVIETIVARTLRQVEMSQQGIRIVGLSATLPNYVDVARFLRVNPYKGLFFFDGRFRPVPLSQTFVGVKKVGGQREIQQAMDEVCYDQAFKFVKKGHQVLVFVHARNATAKLANVFRERAGLLGHIESFLPPNVTTKAYVASRKAIQNSRSTQLGDLFTFGLGIHHAGLVRSDRIQMEKAFAQGHISVLFCTATLAWGVNLPAHAVVIRGTDVFDAEKGQFSDLGVLDVQQIFGRAGRPQFETEGHGIIITMQNKLDKYLAMLIRQAPIESQFFKRIHDNLNAEIALGTVSNIDEAVEWLTYTYYHTRATQNPIAYGLAYTILDKDPDLRNHLTQMVTDVAVKLDRNQMIRFDSVTGYLFATDLGRIASNFYIKYETIEMLNDTGLPVTMSPVMPDDMIISLISMATEFSQLKIREEECIDLEELYNYGCMLPIRGGGLASVAGKVNCLLQSYISRTFIRSFSLTSESLYVQQNAGRLCRAMFEIVLRKGWAQSTNAFLCIAKSIEKRLWHSQSSLRQLTDFISIGVIEKIEGRKLSETQLLDLTNKDIGYMFSCDGDKVYQALRMLPRLQVEATLKPITYTIMQVDAWLTPIFNWTDRLLGKGGAQSFWLLLENIDENIILHQEKVLITKAKVVTGETHHIIFTIPIRDHQLSNRFQLRLASDYFIVDDTVIPLSMHNCILPKSFKAHTDLLPLDPLPIKTLGNPKFEAFYNFSFFNPVQTQVFHSLYKTDENCLIGAPTGSGKTLCAELAMFRLLQDYPGKKCVYIAPLKALVRERVADWKEKFGTHTGHSVIEVSGDFTPDSAALISADILITTPEKWDGITRSWNTREYVRQVGLVIIDEIHLLGVGRGAVLEAIVTRLKLLTRKSCIRHSPSRLIGLSTALANAGDVAEWLGIRDDGLFNFRPSVRPVPIQVHIQGFPGQHYCPRMALMNKPAFKAIMSHSPMKPVLVFVASRRQTRLTAMSFVSHLVSQDDPRQWLHMPVSDLEDLLQSLKDENLKLTLPFGIGIHHAGLSAHERAIVEQLYLNKKIQILVATSTLAWGINMPAHLVIVKGTEYYDGKTCKYVDYPVTDVLQMMGRAGRPQFDTTAVAVIYVQDVKKNFYKKFLYEPFPVESSLLPVIANHVNAEVNAGTITSKQSIMEYLSGTYLYRRFFANPNYYGMEDLSEESMISFLTDIVDNSVQELLTSKCIVIDEEDGSIRPSPFGRLASIYYLQHETIRYLLNSLNATNTVEQLLMILTHVPEYEEVPVRHNEEIINGQIQRRLPIQFPTNVLDSSFTKTHILFQAHFSDLDLPTDYRTDQKSCIDCCIRIIQAMRDICVLHGWFATSINITILQQMCYTGRWHTDHPLLCLPYIKENDADRIGEQMTIPLLQDVMGIEKANGTDIIKHRIVKLLTEKTTLDENEMTQISMTLCRWPILSVNSINICEGMNVRNITNESTGSNKTNLIELQKNSSYKLKITLHTLGPNRFNTEAFLPKWSKEKTAGWIIMIGEKDSGKVISLSHVASIQGKRSVRVEFKTPDTIGTVFLKVLLMSDCYLGIDQEYILPIRLSK